MTDRIDQIVRASTPDPDGPPCEFCGGGLDHYPECVELDPDALPLETAYFEYSSDAS